MIIAVDFDGTIARTNFPVIEDEMPDVKEVLGELMKRGHYVIVWTCRQGRDLLDAVNWMLEHGVPFNRINDECPRQIEIYGGRDFGKVYADVYIDDHNVGGFPGWREVLRILVPECSDGGA